MLPEGRYDVAAPAGADGAVVVLHPHPDLGGDRTVPMVEAVYRGAAGAGWAAVRFDFSSSGMDVATAEAAAALDVLPPVERVAMVGYSFGALVAIRLDDPRVDRWALIAPPFGREPATAPAGADPRPKLLLAPAHDQFCPPAAAAKATAGWAATTIEPIPMADHFLAGAVDAAADRVLRWIGALSGG